MVRGDGVVTTGAGRTQLEGQSLRFGRTGEHVDPSPLGQGDLGGQVGRSAESVDSQRPAGREPARSRAR